MMLKAVAAGVVVLASPLIALFGLVTLAAGGTSGAAEGHALFDPSPDALADIPPLLLSLYAVEATACPGLPWQVLAGIGKVESDHGRFGGATLSPDGTVRPAIIGIALDGTNGTAAIGDTDGGRLDGDAEWDRAVGPLQLIPSSWAIFGQDGNGDGVRDPQNVHDAVPAAVAHLCPAGTVADVEAAILAYNHSLTYVDRVLDWAARYTGPLSSFGQPVAGYAYPAPAPYATTAIATRSHHDSPAIDIAMPVGTPVYASVDGTIASAIPSAGLYVPGGPGRCGNTVILTGIDGATYIYCHLSTVAVRTSQAVLAGQTIGLSGGEPGTPGAGNTSGPHLHYAVRAYGQAVCPQPLLLAIIHGSPIPPQAAPPTGCTYPGSSIDWSEWLSHITFPTPIEEGRP